MSDDVEEIISVLQSEWDDQKNSWDNLRELLPAALASRAPATTPTPLESIIAAVKKHSAGDYNGGGFDWACMCGAIGHYEIAGFNDTWGAHVEEVIRQAAAPAPSPADETLPASAALSEYRREYAYWAAAPGGKAVELKSQLEQIVEELRWQWSEADRARILNLVGRLESLLSPTTTTATHPLQDKQEPALGKVSFQLLTEKDVAEAYQAAPDWFTVLSALECRGKEPPRDEPDFGSAEEVIAGLDRINEHNRQVAWQDKPPAAPVYDKSFGDEKSCQCGHPYYRHFDTYDEMRAIGCRYCPCSQFAAQDKPTP